MPTECPAAQGEALPLLSHLLAAEHVWLVRLERRTASRSVWPTLTLSECEALAAENAAGYAGFLDRRSEGDLTEVVQYKNTKGLEFATPVIDILTHVVIHGAYHRGQIAKALAERGRRRSKLITSPLWRRSVAKGSRRPGREGAPRANRDRILRRLRRARCTGPI